jgi:uncharacterized protein involved in type VI secretion and phage assembly
MDRILNRLKEQARALDRAIGQPRFGIVTSVDPTRYVAKVSLQPEGVQSGWLPILSPWVGNGWGLICVPQPGAQVLVLAQEGDAEHGVIAGAAYGGTIQPPSGAAAGEAWLVHSSGSFLRLRNDGTVQGQAQGWYLQGDLHVQGDVYDQHGPLSELRGHYNSHIHTDSRGGATSAPNPQD